jgi:energy-coupling factor transport system substrate-specific component
VRSLLVIAVALIAASLLVDDGALATLLGAAGLVVAGVAWFESGVDSTRELAVVATIGAAAAAGRVLFAAIPGVQPVTVIAVVAGARSACVRGVATGAIAAFVSNLFLGQGSDAAARCSAGLPVAALARAAIRGSVPPALHSAGCSASPSA